MEEGSLEGVKAWKDTTTARAQGQTGHGEETFPPLSPLTVQYLAKASHWPSPRWRQRGGESWTCNLYASCKGQLPRTQGGHRTVENGWGPSKWRTACTVPSSLHPSTGWQFLWSPAFGVRKRLQNSLKSQLCVTLSNFTQRLSFLTFKMTITLSL